jgi:precorrin-6A/cobalt-precorrin-6A reductase
MRVLILGGTSQASALARALAARSDIDATLSFAGVTQNPSAPPILFRVGGFGGAEGLRAYLEDARIDGVIDATHPYAERISANAVRACSEARVPLAILTRPAWEQRAGDRWIEVEDVGAAARALGDAPRRVFLTHGRLGLAAFAEAPRHFYLVRTIEPPPDIGRLPRHRLLLARGPFALEDEQNLMRAERIDMLVTKNSGGEATYAKIEAARALGLTVVMIRRPATASAGELTDSAAALAWLDAHRPAP